MSLKFQQVTRKKNRDNFPKHFHISNVDQNFESLIESTSLNSYAQVPNLYWKGAELEAIIYKGNHKWPMLGTYVYNYVER